jgi:hypothetical protein
LKKAFPGGFDCFLVAKSTQKEVFNNPTNTPLFGDFGTPQILYSLTNPLFGLRVEFLVKTDGGFV